MKKTSNVNFSLYAIFTNGVVNIRNNKKQKTCIKIKKIHVAKSINRFLIKRFYLMLDKNIFFYFNACFLFFILEYFILTFLFL